MRFVQEIHYLSKGAYRHRKRLFVVYQADGGGRAELVGGFYEGEAPPPGMLVMDALEVSAEQFKMTEKRVTAKRKQHAG